MRTQNTKHESFKETILFLIWSEKTTSVCVCLKATTKTEDQAKGRLFLNVVVSQSATIL